MACKILCMNKSKTPFRGTCKSENLRKLKKKTFEDSKSKILQKKIVLIIWHPKSFRKKSFEGHGLRLCLDGWAVIDFSYLEKSHLSSKLKLRLLVKRFYIIHRKIFQIWKIVFPKHQYPKVSIKKQESLAAAMSYCHFLS